MTERYINPYPLPTTYERELLTCLIEECAEVQKACTKILRFGIANNNPDTGVINGEDLEKELGDIQVLLELLIEAGLVEPAQIDKRKPIKRKKLEQYLQSLP